MSRHPRPFPTPSPTLRRFRAAGLLGLALTLVASLLPAPVADAGGFTRFQHGGRGVAQAGAIVARADSPFAASYNPAGLTELPGVQIEGGLDFSNATDEFTGGAGNTFRADHSIQFPPAVYVSWSDAERLGPWSLGFGLDTPQWFRADFDPVFFPGRFLVRLNELELYQAHPVVAYRINDAWSIGGGLRYQFGSTTWGRNEALDLEVNPGQRAAGEALFDAEADIDGFGIDLGAQYRSTLWGFGALFRSPLELEGADRVSAELRDFPPPFEDDFEAAIADRDRPFDVTVERPAELHAGVWFAPYPELRFEVDAVFTAWGSASQEFSGAFLAAEDRLDVDLMEDWDDTLSLRLGVEGDLSDFIALSGGLAWEPSPVGDSVSAAWPRGDALVYALGASFRYEQVRFDLGYSFHDHDSLAAPPDGRFTSDEQVWSASARYTF